MQSKRSVHLFNILGLLCDSFITQPNTALLIAHAVLGIFEEKTL